jgi:UDP-3-O-[3-hydroxymyristoyl] N-acetylglucosamine deacetylase / 3-hydroxyacyl-[acyl-carrier-protein] dehydratase
LNRLPQRTLSAEARLSGNGLHTGKPASIVFKPAPAGSGIRFFKDGKPVAGPGRSRLGDGSSDSLRCSSLGADGARILTVEHLLASLSGLGITNLDVFVQGDEVPALDGSAAEFVKLFTKTGLTEQSGQVEFYRIREPIFCYDNLKSIAIHPAEEFSVSYVLDYEHPHLRDQKVDFTLTPGVFEREIAPSRTFCTEKEALELPKHGIGLGATPANTLVVKDDGSHVQGLRFPDECARHKVLDIVGDLSLLGFPVLGRVVGIRSGHALNLQLVEAILKQRSGQVGKEAGADLMKLPIEIDGVKAILPHREPFLFVDRIIEMTDKRIVGTKKLTGKEAFFGGHFPARPVMPGVLMIEALAQAGGIFLLGPPERRGKIAYLVSVNEARFRRVVSPGDELRLEVEILKFKSRIGLVKGVAKVGSEIACEAEIMFSLAD